MDQSDFLHRQLRCVNKQAHRLGLAMNYGIDGSSVAAAIEHGVNYFFWTALKTGKCKDTLKSALKRDREKQIVAAGPTIGYFGTSVRSGCESLLKELNIDYIDVLHLFWLGVGSAWTDGTREELLKLKEEQKIRSIGISIHDRERAGKLAADSPIDLFMIRYNAAHPGAEKDIFPHLHKRNPAVVAYTATSWRKLLKKPNNWDGPAMTAGDCYRFCLSSPHVDIVLTGPANAQQLQDNLTAVSQGPLSDEELESMRRYGRLVHG